MFSVCVCVCFGIKMLIIFFFLLRDVFKRSKCYLDPWLSCMFDCIHVYIFLLFEKLFFKQSRQLLDTSRYLAYLLSSSVVFLSQSRHLSIARWINRESFCPLDSSSIDRACFAVDTCSIVEFVEAF